MTIWEITAVHCEKISQSIKILSVGKMRTYLMIMNWNKQLVSPQWSLQNLFSARLKNTYRSSRRRMDDQLSKPFITNFTQTHTQKYTHIRTYIHAYINTHIQICTHTHTHTNTYTRTIYTYAYLHTHTHTHIYIYIYI